MSPVLSIDQKSSLGLEAKKIRLSLLLTQHELANIVDVPLEEVDLFEHGLPVRVDVKLKILRELWARKVGKIKNKVEVNKQQKCRHYWIIDPPGDHISYGKCKRCGTVAKFYNTFTNDLANHIKLPNKTAIQPID